MRPLKEDFFDNLGIGIEAEKEQIKNWLEQHRIRYYHITDDLIINVNGGIDLSGYKEEYLPDFIQFGEVLGYFDISYCKNLKSLKGCPEYVGKNFMCNYCHYLETMEYTPNYVGCDIWFNSCRALKSLKGLPNKINGDLYFNDCPNIKSIDGIPSTITGSLFCKHCGKKFMKKDIKKICNVGKKIDN